MLEYFIYCYAEPLLSLLLCAMAGMLGIGLGKVWKAVRPKLDKLVDRYIDEDTKQSIAKIAVLYVEQVWKNIHGEEKMAKALELGRELLAKKGIDFDAEEFRVLCEAVLAEFNEAFKKPQENEATASAVAREVEDSGDVSMMD